MRGKERSQGEKAEDVGLADWRATVLPGRATLPQARIPSDCKYLYLTKECCHVLPRSTHSRSRPWRGMAVQQIHQLVLHSRNHFPLAVRDVVREVSGQRHRPPPETQTAYRS